MRKTFTYKFSDYKDIKKKILHWANSFKHVIFLDTNNYKNHQYLYKSFDLLVAAGAHEIISSNDNSFEKLKKLYDKHKDWCFGYLSYDLKNEIECLTSENIDLINSKNLEFFIPEYVLIIKENSIKVECFDDNFNEIFDKIIKLQIPQQSIIENISLNSDFTKEDYIETVKNIKSHINYGDIYEMNFCINFNAADVKISPQDVYLKLIEISPVPFSGYLKMNNIYLMCASPERFLKKSGNTIISQPIKGTIKRGITKTDDTALKVKLLNSEKDKSENVMIVDLVRNDLSKIAIPGTVKVEELFGIYEFPQVYQMISTISCKAYNDIHPVDIIKNAFPMGSMTGAPKLKAMQLIEKFEKTKRGIYSGSIGYFDPNGNFDFNVVIRSILYNSENKILSFNVGGAITSESSPEMEYEECLIKAKAILKTIKNKSITN